MKQNQLESVPPSNWNRGEAGTSCVSGPNSKVELNADLQKRATQPLWESAEFRRAQTKANKRAKSQARWLKVEIDPQAALAIAWLFVATLITGLLAWGGWAAYHEVDRLGKSRATRIERAGDE